MSLELTVELPDFPKGEVVDVGGLALKNKEAVALTPEQEEAFLARHGTKVREYFKGSDTVKVSGKQEVTE